MAHIDPVEFARKWLAANHMGTPIPAAMVADLLLAHDAKAAEAGRSRAALRQAMAYMIQHPSPYSSYWNNPELRDLLRDVVCPALGITYASL